MDQAWPLPYVPVLAPFAIDAFVSFCISVLLVVLVNAEAQAFMATLLGDFRKEEGFRLRIGAWGENDIRFPAIQADRGIERHGRIAKQAGFSFRFRKRALQ